MIQFTVIWSNEASNSLAYLWMTSLQRAEVTRKAYVIDQELRFNAQLKGVELHEELRRIEFESLYAKYSVNLLDRQVRVIGLGIDPDFI